jgi:hypothetical protein
MNLDCLFRYPHHYIQDPKCVKVFFNYLSFIDWDPSIPNAPAMHLSILESIFDLQPTNSGLHCVKRVSVLLNSKV